ncbi:two-component system regulatory protein YycI, partial [Indiicoccus explosivorum]|uniref:two-component system regulatory protein YycI n=1 Tax=Indiicoccus explosivorum TaxID=1917864 RepID=UPI0015880653
EATPEELEAFAEAYIPDSEDYTLWNVDEEQNKAVFFQTFEDVDGLPLFYSEEGMITVHWYPDTNEIYSYRQAKLTEVDPGDQGKKLITAIQAIRNLYQQNMLPVGTEITKASLGYAPYSVLAQSSQGGIYTFVPAWRVEAQLSDDTAVNYFVNAVEGDIIQLPPPEPAAQQ